jgi:hypothetical protein
MVDFHFIFVALFYLIAILFIHVQLKKSTFSSMYNTDKPKPIIHTSPLKPTFDDKTIEQSLSNHLDMEGLEQYDNFKSITDSDNDIADEWSKIYEKNSISVKEENVNPSSTLDPEYQKTSLLEDTPVMNNNISDINPFDEFDTVSYMSFAPTN